MPVQVTTHDVGHNRPSGKYRFSPRAQATINALSKFPEYSTRGLAKHLFESYPLLFTSWNSARLAVQYYRGQRHLERGKNMTAFTKGVSVKDDNHSLPDTRYKPYFPYVITNKQSIIGFFCDTHIPYQDNNVLELMFEEFQKRKVTDVIMGGDISDCYQLSTFVRDPSERDFASERNDMLKFLKCLRKRFSRQSILYMEGNHEQRFVKYLMVRAPELFGLSEFRLPYVYNLASFNIDYIDEKRIVKCGHLNLLHGHEYGGRNFNSVNPARSLYLKAKACALQGHNHQTSNHDEPNINGDLIACWSVGCTCYLHPQYMPQNKWNHGFAIIEKEGNDFTLHNLRIVNGKVR